MLHCSQVSLTFKWKLHKKTLIKKSVIESLLSFLNFSIYLEKINEYLVTTFSVFHPVFCQNVLLGTSRAEKNVVRVWNRLEFVHFTMVRFEPSAKIQFCTGIAPAIPRFLDVSSPSFQAKIHGGLAFTIAQFWFNLGVRYGKKTSVHNSVERILRIGFLVSLTSICNKFCLNYVKISSALPGVCHISYTLREIAEKWRK